MEPYDLASDDERNSRVFLSKCKALRVAFREIWPNANSDYCLSIDFWVMERSFQRIVALKFLSLAGLGFWYEHTPPNTIRVMHQSCIRENLLV